MNMVEKYGVRDDWDGLMETMDTLEKAEKLFEAIKESKMSEGVDVKESFVSIVSSDDDFETETIVKKVVPVRDEEMTKEIGTPQQNGFEWNYWAKWEEVTA
jgi:hypothetical protein